MIEYKHSLIDQWCLFRKNGELKNLVGKYLLLMIRKKGNTHYQKKIKQAGAELGQAQYKIGHLGKLMSSASCKASIEADFY